MTQSNSTALVTGGAKRIGNAIAHGLHAAGYNVVVHYRSSSQAAQQLVDELNDTRKSSAKIVQADLLDVKSIPRLLHTVIEEFGQLNVLVNNASTFYPTPIELLNEDFWNDLMGSNLKAPAFLAKEAAAELRRTNGSIINIVDIYARNPLKNHSIYCAAKAGLEMLTKSLARELAPEVRVNGISPGIILWPEKGSREFSETKLIKRIPLQRMGAPEDIAKTVKFLVADADYITGQIIAVDGGRSIVM